jgi:putative intracellular protease/amidase
LVKGLKVTGFSDSEEAAVGLTDKVPELIETAMKAQGGLYTSTADWTPNAVVDGNLVTGQNPASSTACANAFVELLA